MIDGFLTNVYLQFIYFQFFLIDCYLNILKYFLSFCKFMKYLCIYILSLITWRVCLIVWYYYYEHNIMSMSIIVLMADIPDFFTCCFWLYILYSTYISIWWGDKKLRSIQQHWRNVHKPSIGICWNEYKKYFIIVYYKTRHYLQCYLDLYYYIYIYIFQNCSRDKDVKHGSWI